MSGDAAGEFLDMATTFAAAPARFRAEARAAMRKTGADIQGTAQNLAPVDTGTLRNSITSDYTENAQTLRIEIGPTVNYGAFVERGTSRNRAQPYLRPAVERHEPGLLAAFAQLSERALRER